MDVFGLECRTQKDNVPFDLMTSRGKRSEPSNLHQSVSTLQTIGGFVNLYSILLDTKNFVERHADK
jgi:hypothetical protein